MAPASLLDRVHALSDLELALLLCLAVREHCLISGPAHALDDLLQELQLAAARTFGLAAAVVRCGPETTLEDFAAALLLPPAPNTSPAASRAVSPLLHARHAESYFTARPRGGAASAPGASPLASASSRVANVVLARDLDRAPLAVQVQALELLRTRRIFTRTAVKTAPKQFVFVPVLASPSGGGGARVTPHLNDFFFVPHWHDPEDGLANLEEWGPGEDDETASTGSVVKRGHGVEMPLADPDKALISESEISHLGKLSQLAHVDVDVTRFQMNIVSSLRMHRAVASGITPTATKHFGQLMRLLAPLHNLDFVTPALVALAAKKVYLHRINITPPEKERSMQWGSDIEAVEAVLQDVGPEEVIEDVLEMVTAPL